MANTQTIRLGRDASNNKQWAIREGGLLGMSTSTFDEYPDRYVPYEYKVVRATSATRVNELGLIESVDANVPRIDFLNDTKGKLLIEPQRTNLITYSEELDNAAWQKLNSSVSANATTSPEGTTTADKLVEDGLTAEHIIRSSAISITSSNTYILSVFAKQGERSIIRMGADDQGNLPGRAFFDLSTGLVGTITGGASASIEDYGNGWYRCIVIATAAGTTSGVNIEVNLATAGEIVNYLGDGASGTYLWGGQIEEGSYATSYIPTTGSIATRNVELIYDVNNKFQNFYNQTEGTLYFEVDTSHFVVGQTYIYGSMVGAGIYIRIRTTSLNNLQIELFNGSTFIDQSNKPNTLVSGNNKFTVSYKDGERWKFCINGTYLEADNIIANNLPFTSTSLGLQGVSTSVVQKNLISDFRYYDRQLTQAEQEALTS